MNLPRLEAYRLYVTLEVFVAFVFKIIFTLNMVYQITVAQLEPLQLVLVGTMLEVSVFLFEVPTGVVADVFSRRLSIIIGYFLIGIGFIIEGSFPVFGAILLGQICWGIGYTFTSGATQAWISDEIGEQAANQAFLRGSQFANFGALLGIGASILLGVQRVNLPIIVGGGLFILFALFLIVCMPERGFKPTSRQERTSWLHMAQTFRSGIGLVRARPALFNILWVGLLYGFYSEGFDRLWTRHLVDRFSLPALDGLPPLAWFGLIEVVGLILSVAAIEVARRRLDTYSYHTVRRGLFLVTAALIVGLFGFALLDVFPLAVAMLWLITVTRGVIGPIYTAWVNQRLDSSARATVLSMSSQVDAIGQIAGGPSVGLIGNLVSVRAALAASAIILTPQLALLSHSPRLTPELETEPAIDL
jgi:DHA3 family tetracycline resistance protein-like MFS transporter